MSHAQLAGAVVGGLATVWGKQNRRGLIVQQLFVRCVGLTATRYSANSGFSGLQGSTRLVKVSIFLMVTF
jgi:hypothetical protein